MQRRARDGAAGPRRKLVQERLQFGVVRHLEQWRKKSEIYYWLVELCPVDCESIWDNHQGASALHVMMKLRAVRRAAEPFNLGRKDGSDLGDVADEQQLIQQLIKGIP